MVDDVGFVMVVDPRSTGLAEVLAVLAILGTQSVHRSVHRSVYLSAWELAYAMGVAAALAASAAAPRSQLGSATPSAAVMACLPAPSEPASPSAEC